MADGYYKAVCAELTKLGYSYRGTNRHEVWANAAGKKLTVPFNLKSRHTANGLLKDAGSPVRL